MHADAGVVRASVIFLRWNMNSIEANSVDGSKMKPFRPWGQIIFMIGVLAAMASIFLRLHELEATAHDHLVIIKFQSDRLKTMNMRVDTLNAQIDIVRAERDAEAL